VAEYYAQPDLESGRLVEVLSDYKNRAYDILMVFQQRKRMALRLRVFSGFMIDLFDPPPWAMSGFSFRQGQQNS
jgi:DNA-binding transcriptional LysR family regulator